MHPAPNLVEAPPKASSAEEGSRAGSVPHQQPSTPQPSHDALPPQLPDAPPPQAENEIDHDNDQVMSPAPPAPPAPTAPMQVHQQPLSPPPQHHQQQHEQQHQHQPQPQQAQPQQAQPQQAQPQQHFEPLGTPIGPPVIAAHVGVPIGAPISAPVPSTPPPVRKDTNSSISTQATLATTASAATNVSMENSNSSYSADTSPTMTSIFHVKGGVDVSNRVRASRRRTGPLSQQQREKAALIRKLGACPDCRRRRVACHPSHHNMTWEDAVKKYHRSHSPTIQDIAPSLSGQRPLSPSQGLSSLKTMFPHDPNEMDIDQPMGQPGQARLSDARLRTPLPTGPRLDKPNMLPGIETLKTDLQANVSRILSNPHRSRYASVQVLLFYWQDDTDPHVQSSVTELADVLDQFYHYTFHVETIPSTSEACKSPWRWLSRKITDFSEDRDQRDVLKIVYYNGYSYLDGNREMVLASSKDKDKAETLRWSGIQQVLEEACSDTLILMDAAYYPSSKMVRQQGVLELVAAAVSEEHFSELERCTFTKILAELLRTRASQRFTNSFSAAELHSKLLSSYPSLIQDRNPERETMTSFPSPLHMQIAGDARLASILLAPMNISPPRTSLPFGTEGQQLHLSFRLEDDPIDVDAWTEWLRIMPDGVKEARVEGPYRPVR